MIVWDKVIEDMKTRNRQGYEKYGRYLTPFNQRSHLRDAYEETLDKAVYLKAWMEEVKVMHALVLEAKAAHAAGEMAKVGEALTALESWLEDAALR